ncbi:MAG: DUF362 domain-containing protein [Candidatus Bathyarchaeia archaeon]
MPKVAVVKTKGRVSESYQYALRLIGETNFFNAENVTIKVGIYDEKNLNHPTVPVVKAVVDSFALSKRILIVESDNHSNKAIKRLQEWKEIFSDRVIPFSLSDDTETREVTICGEKIRFSSSLFKPNFLVSLHVLRKGKAGCIFKNLLGLIPDVRKERFHDKLGVALIEMAQSVGWLDLAVIDGTYVYGSEWKEGVPMERERKDLLVVGRDPVAVETVGSILAEEDPLSVPALAVARERKLGETDINKIQVVGEDLKNLFKR